MKLTEEDFIIIQQKIDRINQKLSNLYKNWQAGYRSMVTQEDCDEVEKFYKPFLDRYESKFRIHYQMLQQMTRQADLADLPSTHKQTSDFTPSLAALDDAEALIGREWNRNEPGEEILRQYSTPCGYLTLTQLRQDFMRIDSTLNITPEGSQNECNILTTLRGDVDQTESQQTPKTSEQRVADNHPSATALDGAAETPYTPIKVIPRGHLMINHREHLGSSMNLEGFKELGKKARMKHWNLSGTSLPLLTTMEPMGVGRSKLCK